MRKITWWASSDQKLRSTAFEINKIRVHFTFRILSELLINLIFSTINYCNGSWARSKSSRKENKRILALFSSAVCVMLLFECRTEWVKGIYNWKKKQVNHTKTHTVLFLHFIEEREEFCDEVLFWKYLFIYFYEANNCKRKWSYGLNLFWLNINEELFLLLLILKLIR